MTVPDASRRAVAVRYGCTPGEVSWIPCWWCGLPGKLTWHRGQDGKPRLWVSFEHEWDHLIPKVDGGSGDPTNIVPACRRCNRRRRFIALRPHHILTALGVRTDRPAHEPLSTGKEGKGREGSRKVGHASHDPHLPREGAMRCR